WNAEGGLDGAQVGQRHCSQTGSDESAELNAPLHHGRGKRGGQRSVLQRQPCGGKSRIRRVELGGGRFQLCARGLNLRPRGIVLGFGGIEIRLGQTLAFAKRLRSREICLGPGACSLSLAHLRPRSLLVLTSSIQLALRLSELNVVVLLPKPIQHEGAKTRRIAKLRSNSLFSRFIDLLQRRAQNRPWPSRRSPAPVDIDCWTAPSPPGPAKRRLATQPFANIDSR